MDARKASGEVHAPAKPNGGAGTLRNRPTIRVVRGQLGRIVDEIEDALIKADLGL